MANPTMGLRERKNARTREAITRATLELALEAGFDRATVAQIAERADVSPRTVHQWFPSKEDIVVGGADPLFYERLAAALAEGEGDVLDRLRRWTTAEGNWRSEPEDLARLRHRVLLSDPDLRAAQRGRLQDVEKHIAAAIAEETSSPAEAVGPRALAAAMVTTLLAMQEAFAHGVEPDTTGFEDAEQMLHAALGALRDARR